MNKDLIHTMLGQLTVKQLQILRDDIDRMIDDKKR